MNKLLSMALSLVLSVSMFGCTNDGQISANLGTDGQVKAKQEPQKAAENDKAAVELLVTKFGRQLQAVSLLAPRDILKENIQEKYGDFVFPELLSAWLSEPQAAPGRLTSSPWPERIEIRSIEKLSNDTYKVQGEIIEMTSTEKVAEGVAAKRPITLVVKRVINRWLIAEYLETSPTVYKNSQLGFSFSLPASWKDYQIVTSQWEGFFVGGSQGQERVETGPMISIRHPRWTPQDPRQDIPIMILTITQWNSLREGKFHIGAAPVGPSELGRSAGYVFALPARYNYAFATGYEEVGSILASNPLGVNEAGSDQRKN